MKAIVEWGKPKWACKNRPCGISGQFIAVNPEQARMLASQMFHTLVEGAEHVVNNKGAWGVSQREPRKVVWSTDRTAWVAVSLLDGVPRGPYASLADKESLKGGVCSPEAEALGFSSDAQMREHEQWLRKHGTPEFKAWLKGVLSLTAD